MAIIDHEAELIAPAPTSPAAQPARLHGAALSAGRDRRDHRVTLCYRCFRQIIAPFDPTSTDSKSSLARPGSVFWLGADFMGRDMFSRIVYGARISLAVGMGATLMGGLLGVSIGLMSGYLGGAFDLLTQRLLDVMQSLPLLVMALVMAAALGPSLENTIVAIAIPLVPTVARVVRFLDPVAVWSSRLSMAARAVGMASCASPAPRPAHTLAKLTCWEPAQLGSAILVEASLSFLASAPRSLSVLGPHAVGSAAEYVRTAPWLVIFPGVAISMTVFGTNSG